MINKSSVLCLSLILASCATQPTNSPTHLVRGHQLSQQGIQAFQNEQWVKAERLFQQALRYYQSVDASQGIAHCHINLSQLELRRHNFEPAQYHLKQAKSVVQQSKLTSLKLRLQLLAATLAMQQQKYNQAETLLRNLLPLSPDFPAKKKMNALQLSAISLRTKLAFVIQKESELWLQRYQTALQTSPDNFIHQARILRFQAQILIQKGELTQAEIMLHKILAKYKKNDLRSGIAATLGDLAQLHLQQHNLQQARNFFSRAANVYRSLRNKHKLTLISKQLDQVIQAINAE